MSAAAQKRARAVAGSGRRGGSFILARRITGLALALLATLFVADRLYDPALFPIHKVEVRGSFHQVDGAQLESVVKQSLAGNYFSLDLAAIEARIVQLPWVFSASVRRRWPDTLVVKVVEVQPVAKWGSDQWFNATGDLVARRAAPGERDLPLLFAPDEHRQAVWRAFRDWSRLFATHGLSLEQLRLDPRGLWQMEISRLPLSPEAASAAEQHSVAVIVERENAEARVGRFVEALRRELFEAFAAMRSVDLRYPNGFAVGWLAAPPAGKSLAAQ